MQGHRGYGVSSYLTTLRPCAPLLRVPDLIEFLLLKLKLTAQGTVTARRFAKRLCAEPEVDGELPQVIQQSRDVHVDILCTVQI